MLAADPNGESRIALSLSDKKNIWLKNGVNLGMQDGEWLLFMKKCANKARRQGLRSWQG